MELISRACAARTGVGAVLTLLIAASLPHEAPAAGCSGPHPFGPEVAHLEHLAGAGALARTGGSGPPAPAPRCSGLRCSAGDSLPSAPAAPISSLRSELWGALASVPGVNRAATVLVSFDEANVRPIIVGASLFRPPRDR